MHTDLVPLQAAVRAAVIAVCAMGFLLFGTSWAVLRARPAVAEAAAFDFISASVANEVKARLGDQARLTPGAHALLVTAVLREAQRQYQELLDAHVEQYVARALARICQCADGKPAAWAQAAALGLPEAWKAKVRELDVALHNADGLIRQESHEHISRLLTDLGIFTSINALLCTLTGALAFVARARARALLVPSALLLVSTLLCSYWYVFNQNWFHRLLFNEFAGAGYATYVGAVFAMLCDVALNEGRVLTAIMSSVGVPPC